MLSIGLCDQVDKVLNTTEYNNQCISTGGYYNHSVNVNSLSLGEKPGLVVRAEGSRPRGRGFESRRILDGCKRC